MVDTEVANATATREAEAAENAETTADSKSAQVALETTISLLPRVYKGQGKPQRFFQDPAADAPTTWYKEWHCLGGACRVGDMTFDWNTSWCYDQVARHVSDSCQRDTELEGVLVEDGR